MRVNLSSSWLAGRRDLLTGIVENKTDVVLVNGTFICRERDSGGQNTARAEVIKEVDSASKPSMKTAGLLGHGVE